MMNVRKDSVDGRRRSRTLRLLLALCCAVSFATALATEPVYPRDVALWEEVRVPSKAHEVARQLWSYPYAYTANYSLYSWQVFARNNRVCARLVIGEQPKGE